MGGLCLAARGRAARRSGGGALDPARAGRGHRHRSSPVRQPSRCYRTETANYIDNLGSGAPQLWVVLRPTDGEPPYEVLAVTADPAEGEAFTEAGNDLVETVPMPADIKDALEAFVAEHHVERTFFKRQRDSGAEGAPGGGRKRRETGP